LRLRNQKGLYHETVELWLDFFSQEDVPFAYLMLLCVLSSALCLVAYERKWLHPGRRFEALVEGNFFLAGLLGLIWQIVT
jgi:hypothetical protein